VNEQSISQKFKLSPAVIIGIILFVIFGIALYIRIALPYDQVFINGSIWFKGNDPWYHMRLVENLAQNFPHHIYFDPYTYFPQGQVLPWPPFLDWLIVAISKIISFGHPTLHTMETVAAYLPAILGSLVVIPVYFIGKELFNKWVGIISAALVAILPGEFLNRSLLGFTDHHVTETLFSTVVILFLILAVKKAREREISFSHLANKDWATIRRPLIYTLVAGIFLGIYLLTWVGGLMFVFILAVWLVIQFIIDHLRGKSTDYLCIIGFPIFFIAFIMSAPFLPKTGLSTVFFPSLIIAMLAPLALSAISWAMTRKSLKPFYYPVALAGIAGIGFAIFFAINPSLIHSMLSKFSVFNPGVVGLTIQEVQPTTLSVAWASYTTAFFIAFISFGLLIYRSVKEESADKTLFLVWSVIMLIAVFGQRRFTYYYAVNASLLTGYFCWRVLDFAGLRELLTRPKEAVKAYTKTIKEKKKRGKKARVKVKVSERRFLQPRAAWIKVIVAGVVIFFLVFFPSIGLPGIKPYTKVCGLPIKLTQPLAESPGLMSQAWYDSLLWLRDNSTDPFDNPEFYYQLYDLPPENDHGYENYAYPETAYGVISWWDYGHWITRIAHRIPIANPFQRGASTAGRYFIAQNVTSANEMMDELGARYVIIDYQMATGKFYAMAEWARSVSEDVPDEFYGIYYVQGEGGMWQPVQLFYPSYYNSTTARLYNFDGKEVVPEQSIVISWERKLSQGGIWFNAITESKSFSSYEEAEAYIASQESGNYQIVSPDAFASPVPLEKLEHYELVYNSIQLAGDEPFIKIFKYTE
jgi:dolichyl-diphosphooligosaccharide--protein glycosyltransferase